MKQKILVVDDEPDFVNLIQMRLEALHYQVLTASNGREALTSIKTEKPAVVLLDIKMPEMDGLEMLQKIRRTDKKIPIYILTAYSDEELFRRAGQLGASGYMVKTQNIGQGIKNITGILRVASKYRGRPAMRRDYRPAARKKREATHG